jgi:hypothetical protein
VKIRALNGCTQAPRVRSRASRQLV